MAFCFTRAARIQKHRDGTRETQAQALGQMTKGKALQKDVASSHKEKVLVIIEALIAIVIDLVMLVCFNPLMKLAPEREFFLDDHSIGYTYIPNEKVPTWLLVLFAIIMLLTGPIIEWATSSFKRCVLLVTAYILASCPMLFVCQFLKIVVARLRPDFLSRCDPDPVTLICRNEDETAVTNGRTSFPSGHCTCIFYAATCLGIYFCMFFSPFKYMIKKGAKKGQSLLSLRILLVLAPFIVALYVAAERNTDHRHHPGDILAGSILGISGAVLSLFLVRDLYGKFKVGEFGHYKDTETVLLERPDVETLTSLTDSDTSPSENNNREGEKEVEP